MKGVCVVYLIPKENLAAFAERVGKLNARAKRLGVAEIAWSTEHAYFLNEYRNASHCQERWFPDREVAKSSDEDGNPIRSLGDPALPPEGDWKPTGRMKEVFALEVVGKAPKFDGWALIGCLSPISLDDGKAENIIRAVPGESVPSEYRDRVGECDHCQLKRRRSETFVVRHDNGETKMVGRTCLKDFLGHKNPHALAAAAEILMSLNDLCGDAEGEDWGMGGSHAPSCWNLEHFLLVTSAVIRKEGWLSKAKAGEWGTSTASHVLGFLNPTPLGFRKAEESEWLEEIGEMMKEEKFREGAEAAKDWATELEPGDNDYLYNLNLLARAGYVESRTSGLAASMITAYRRAKDLDAEGRKREPKSESHHVGTLKKRAEFTVTCGRIFENEGHYGVTGIHRMTDPEGNDLVWFASGSTKWLEEGETYLVKATPKKHDEFRGRKQTVVSRLAILKELSTEK